jgi:hypothetical protein
MSVLDLFTWLVFLGVSAVAVIIRKVLLRQIAILNYSSRFSRLQKAHSRRGENSENVPTR